MAEEVTYEYLVRHIAEIVAKETAKPGIDAYKSQAEWSDLFGMTKSTTRDIFQRLSKLGMLEIKTAKRFRIDGKATTVPVYRILPNQPQKKKR